MPNFQKYDDERKQYQPAEPETTTAAETNKPTVKKVVVEDNQPVTEAEIKLKEETEKAKKELIE